MLKNKNLFKFFLFEFILTFVFITNALSNDNYIQILNILEKNKIYNEYRWKRLLHFDDKNKSNIIDNNFWLSKEKTAKLELIELINIVYNNDIEIKKNAVCKFPARIKFVFEKFNIDKKLIEDIRCEEFDKYLKSVPIENVYLSYASENILSPMSMMGHLFIKIVGFNKKLNRNSEHALSYYAFFDKDNENELMFYTKSLFGKTNAMYNITPYNKKLIEYNDLESRNIYEYELDLTNEQKIYFLYHIWELKNINVPYNFINHNCGTATVMILNVVDEKFNNISKELYITPLDIIKKLYKKNLIKSLSLFPSDNFKIQMFKDNFNYKESKIIKNFVLKDDDFIFKSERKNDLLFMTDIVSGQYVLDKKITRNKYLDIQNKIANNFDGFDSVDLIQKNKNYLNSSLSSSIKVGFERYKQNNGIGINFYPAYRSITDNNFDYFNEFSLQLLNTDLFLDLNNNKIILKELNVLKVKSITPTTYFLPAWSFGFNIGYLNSYDLNDNNGNFVFELGVGKSLFLNDNFIIFAMLNGGMFNKLYLNIETGTIFKYKNLKTIFSYKHYYGYQIDDLININQSVFLKDNLSLELKFSRVLYKNNYNNFNCGFVYHF